MSKSVDCTNCHKFYEKFAKCDACSLNFCRQCSQLTLKEFNCAILNTRRLKYFCTLCDNNNNSSKLSEDLFPTQNSIDDNSLKFVPIKYFEEEMNKITEVIFKTKEEMTHLRESNIDLVKFLTSEEYLNRAKFNNNNNHYNQSSKTVQIIQNLDKVNKNNEKSTLTNVINPCQSTSKNDNLYQEINRNYEISNKNVQSNQPKCVWGSRDTSLLQVKKKIRKFWIFTSGYSNNTNAVQIISYLKQFHDVDISCEKVVTKNNEINSFKVGVPFEYKENFLSKEIWPRGAYVNKYFFPKKIKVGLNNFDNNLNLKN